ncbi:MAG: hypothetical protein QM749_00400 [Aquabacterium sp.]
MWQFIAFFIASRPRLVGWLIRCAKRSPYVTITHDGSVVYMKRWWLMPRCLLHTDKEGNLMPRSWVPFSLRIHHIVLPDSDRDLHDHPFDYRTIILDGFYVEEDIFGAFRFRNTGDTVKARAQTFHRIDKVSDGGVWTLFIMGPRINGWGFLVGGHKVPYRRYLGMKDGS